LARGRTVSNKIKYFAFQIKQNICLVENMDIFDARIEMFLGKERDI
jgi:hypothetical protein